MGLDEIRTKRDELIAIARGLGAGNLRVFGSVARGAAGPASDVDFLVDYFRPVTLVEAIRLQRRFEEVLQRRVDVVAEAELHPSMRSAVLAEALTL